MRHTFAALENYISTIIGRSTATLIRADCLHYIKHIQLCYISKIIVYTYIHIRGVQKNTKVRYKLADKLIPFLWGIIRSTENLKFLGGREVIPLDSIIYIGNFEKYKGKIRKQDISVFGHKNNFLGYLRWLAAFLRF